MPGTTDELPRDANGRFTSESDGAPEALRSRRSARSLTACAAPSTA